MDSDNKQSTDDPVPLPPPPSYMPPMNELQSSINVPPVDSTNPNSTKKPSNTPIWVWIALAVFVVGVLGTYGWNWYQSSMIADTIESSNNIPADNLDYNQNYGYNQTNINKCSETPDANSVCIGDRIWMKKNLSEGVMINNSKTQTDNGVLEKYCYNNDLLNCDTYGGLYQWDEMMQYSAREAEQGICPIGFHVPVETEWNNLLSNLNGDLSGFNNLFGGIYRKEIDGNNSFVNLSKANFYWFSTQYDTKDLIKLYARGIEIYDGYNNTKDDYNISSLPKGYAISVRCIKNLM